MNKIKKIKDRTIWLAMTFMLLAMLTSQRVYGAETVRGAGSNTAFPAEYSLSISHVDENTVTETFGIDNLAGSVYDPNQYSPNRYFQELKSDSQKGNVGIIYRNVGNDGHGRMLDLRVTLRDWGGLHTDWKILEADGSYTAAPPAVMFSSRNISVNIVAVDWVKVNFCYYYANSNTKAELSGHATLKDLDNYQAFDFSDTNIKEAYILENETFLGVEGTKISAPADLTADEDRKAWSTLLFDNDFRLQFYASGAGVDGRIMKRKNAAGGFITGSHFSFCSKTVDGYFDIPDPQKRVGAYRTGWEEAVPVADGDTTGSKRGQAFPISTEDKFSYIIRQQVTPNDITSFVLEDELDPALVFESMAVFNQEGMDCSNRFELAQDGQKLVVTATGDALVDDSFSDNQIYDFRMDVSVNKKILTEQYETYFPDGGWTFTVPNRGKTSIMLDNGREYGGWTDQVWVRGDITFIPVIEKTAKYEYRVGDVIPYTVTFSVKEEGTFAENVVLQDELPQGLELRAKSLKIAGADDALLSTEGNTWEVKIPRVDYGQEVVIEYSATVSEEANGKEALNTVKITAPNIRTGQNPEGNPHVDTWHNTPELTIEKEADREICHAGEEINYTVTITNTAEGTIAKNVVLTDKELPKVLTLTEDAQIEGVPETVEYPVQDRTDELDTETVENQWGVVTEEGKPVVNILYLPSQTPVTMKFTCKVEEDASPQELVNVAHVSCENGNEAEDDATVKMEESPKATETPTPTVTPEATATPTPTPKVTATPKATVTPKPTITTQPVTRTVVTAIPSSGSSGLKGTTTTTAQPVQTGDDAPLWQIAVILAFAFLGVLSTFLMIHLRKK